MNILGSVDTIQTTLCRADNGLFFITPDHTESSSVVLDHLGSFLIVLDPS